MVMGRHRHDMLFANAVESTKSGMHYCFIMGEAV